MGVNNKQRRAAKRRRRARGRDSRESHAQSSAAVGADDEAIHADVEFQLRATVILLRELKHDDHALQVKVDRLLARIRPAPRQVLEILLVELLDRLAEQVERGGWARPDLDQFMRRGPGDRHLPMLHAVLEHRRTLPIQTDAGLASALAVAARLSAAPLLDADTLLEQEQLEGAVAHPKLAQVRALLAKAESTDFDEEAEALSAKAQELISRYALGRLVGEAGQGRDRARPRVRRIWLDSPYVRAKASLVHEVASANRCRAASADDLGFTLVVGDPVDLEGVEMLVTSLLVQANTAMLRQGRRVDRRGNSRTRAFRQSFLLAYAMRIGERLRMATDDVVTSEGGRELLPVLRDHETRVSEAFDALIPHTVLRQGPAVNDGEGWSAGLVAADLASLDVGAQLARDAG